ncbi:MAG: hypothetical protein KKF27_20330 [Gammaproteobacteria bacterium]|nr:hypothetical protein [Gammaproteobacteria bacterium]
MDKEKVEQKEAVIVKDELPSGDAEVTDIDKQLAEAGFTAEELSDLSDTEKAALLMGDEDSEGKIDTKALEAIVGEGEVKKEEAKETPAVVAPVVDVKPDEKEVKTSEALDDDQLLNYRVTIRPEDIKIDDAVPEALETKLTELDTKYDAGDVTLAEYNRGRDAINREIFRAQDQAINTARTEKAWVETQKVFLNNRKEYLKLPEITDPKELMKRDAMYGALEKMVDSITSNPAKAHLSDMQILIEADKAVKEVFGLTPEVKKAEATAAVAAVGKKPPAKRPDIVTLTDIPAAAENMISDDPYISLDSLTGEAYEEALERLTPQQQAAYEKWASTPSKRRVAVS